VAAADAYLEELASQVDVPVPRGLLADVSELLAVRGALVHNHLWESDSWWPEKGRARLQLITWRMLAGYGDPRFEQIVDMPHAQTRVLRMNVYPTRVWRRDAYVALQVALDTLAWLESIRREYIPVTHLQFYSVHPPLSFKAFRALVDEKLEELGRRTRGSSRRRSPPRTRESAS
jgi:hypothetical protein